MHFELPAPYTIWLIVETVHDERWVIKQNMLFYSYKLLQTACGVLLSVFLVGGVATNALADAQLSMLPLERKLQRQFFDVSHMFPEQLEALRSEHPGDIVLLDVRELNEFTVSHLPGAEQVAPGISKPDFMAKFAPKLKGKIVVLYCSVGYRSSKLASRVQQQLSKLGVKEVHNLRGGIFAWHNTGRAVMKGNAETDLVHPYSKSWSRYLDFGNYAEYGKNRSWWSW